MCPSERSGMWGSGEVWESEACVRKGKWACVVTAQGSALGGEERHRGCDYYRFTGTISKLFSRQGRSSSWALWAHVSSEKIWMQYMTNERHNDFLLETFLEWGRKTWVKHSSLLPSPKCTLVPKCKMAPKNREIKLCLSWICSHWQFHHQIKMQGGELCNFLRSFIG